jgi:branched-chain amino acid transport system ATP-binding protein
MTTPEHQPNGAGPLLELKGVRAGYGRFPVLFDIDLSIGAGEWLTVVGGNGAGRSTLLKTILGVTTVTGGDIFFDGRRITGDPSERRVAAGISMVPEGRRIFPTLSVKENLISGAYGKSNAAVAQELQKVFEVFPKLSDRSSQRAGSLSGGEQQMLAIGRSLMSQPRVLLVDELSLGLAPIIVQSLLAALSVLCQNGLSVFVVDQEHVRKRMAKYSTRQLVLEKGRFVTESTLQFGAGAMAGAS